MNKEHFLALLQDSSLSEKEVDNLEGLATKHPYSQPIKALLARSSRGVSKDLYRRSINLAAVYASERTALKDFVESVERQAIQKKPANKPPQKKSAIKANKPATERKRPTPKVVVKALPKNSPKTTAKTSIDAAKLRDEVLYNLQELQKHKSELTELFDQPNKPIKKTRTTKKAPAQKKTESKTNKKPASKTSRGTKSTKTSKKDEPGKHELIEKFIKESPSITPRKKYEGDQEDLAKKSVTLKEDIVSENLAEIFARQGKIKKAEEIYRKLIWKFPQKKAFFASRIEEIKLRN